MLSLNGDGEIIITVITTITMVYLSAIHDIAQTVGQIEAAYLWLPRISSNAPPVLTTVRAQGAYAFRKDAKDAIPGELSAGRPCPRCFATCVCSLCFMYGRRICYLSERFRLMTDLNLDASDHSAKLNTQETRAEEESVLRQGRRGPGGHGWLKRLSDLPEFPSQARIYSKLISLYPLNHLQKSSPPFPQTKKNLSFQTGF